MGPASDAVEVGRIVPKLPRERMKDHMATKEGGE
jgi:hypothetical protein